jgi:hypothetical protein
MDANMTVSEQIGWRFGLQWVLLTIAGLTIGFIAGFVLAEIGLGLIGLETVLGATVCFTQWLVLRRVIKTGISWVLTSLIGFGVSSSLHTLALYVWKLPEDLGIPLGAAGWAIAFVLGGTLTGILQQRILRHDVHCSGWWVPANMAGWGLGMAGLGTLFLFFHIMKNGPVVLRLINNVIVPMLIPSVILGVITAGTLIWLMRRPIEQTPITKI